ncbi:Guanosine polyphosphate pyrophosphohydrolases/synthetases [Mycobacteroides abscessus subsp. abscessus]|uniref:hypothetical protein n=1 Tax=Mycobacteroides abscessus TaxID=36809 RepID=UPI00092A2E2B|nr:hypothetical protein [Mycobacteroides abscessus]SHU66184.1 Guanosine polyphosphate pyrophosphohydrolases/synthetases [Mycobacteroides abscessus subsp. abscessus]
MRSEQYPAELDARALRNGIMALVSARMDIADRRRLRVLWLEAGATGKTVVLDGNEKMREAIERDLQALTRQVQAIAAKYDRTLDLTDASAQHEPGTVSDVDFFIDELPAGVPGSESQLRRIRSLAQQWGVSDEPVLTEASVKLLEILNENTVDIRKIFAAMSETERARRIAFDAHAGQRDKLGRDYFDAHLVPIASAAKVFGDTVTAAAWLHDVLEDTLITATDLKSVWVSPTVIQAVQSVTRREDETYTELIDRACADPVGRLVKLIDNAWNITCNPLLAEADPKRAASMLKDRYEPARRRLLAACDLDQDSPVVAEMQRTLDAAAARLSR